MQVPYRAMLIKARLTGHNFDLITLAELFREGRPAVAVDDDGHYLSFVAPDELLDDGARLYKIASSLLRQVNGVARVLRSDFRPVALVGHFHDEVGRQHAVVLAETAEARARVFSPSVAVDGQQATALPAPGPGYLELAGTHPDVAEALALLGEAGPAPDWVELFKVLEIVRDNVGGLKPLKRQGWVAASDLDAFTASANRPDISGVQARHARTSPKPPRKRTMTLIEARQMIDGLVTAWLDSLRP